MIQTNLEFYCGPARIRVGGELPEAAAKIESLLELFNVRWPDVAQSVQVHITADPAPFVVEEGTYLVSRNMRVDHTPEGLRATCEIGTAAAYSAPNQSWIIYIKDGIYNNRVSASLERIASLITTTAWRELGWVPIHGGAVIKEDVCALICAPSGGGKTTLTTALVNFGWQTLGDDKLLLRIHEGKVELRALLHIFNMHPEAERWFEQLAELRSYPEYSIWTPKRRLPIETFWPDSRAYCSRPTHLIQIKPIETKGVMELHPMSQTQVLDSLLRQTVIPKEPHVARKILGTVSQTAFTLNGYEMHLGREIYATSEKLEEFQRTLLQTS